MNLVIILKQILVLIKQKLEFNYVEDTEDHKLHTQNKTNSH